MTASASAASLTASASFAAGMSSTPGAADCSVGRSCGARFQTSTLRGGVQPARSRTGTFDSSSP